MQVSNPQGSTDSAAAPTGHTTNEESRQDSNENKGEGTWDSVCASKNFYYYELKNVLKVMVPPYWFLWDNGTGPSSRTGLKVLLPVPVTGVWSPEFLPVNVANVVMYFIVFVITDSA